jgi:hypothetical protein
MLAKSILNLQKDAANNFDDILAVVEFYKLIDKKNISLVMYIRIAAFAARIPAEIFSNLEALQHSIGSYLRNCYVKQDVTYYKVVYSLKPYKDITQERFLRTKTNFFKKHPSRLLPSLNLFLNRTLLLLNKTPLLVEEQIKPYLIFAIIYNTLSAFYISSKDVAIVFSVLNTKSIINQISIYKVIRTPKL